jgi:hypothetical protein
MTVAEFIVWLQTQDQEATVQVVRHTSGTGYEDQGGNAEVMDFTVDEIAPYTHLYDAYTDMTQRTLLLGEING